MELPEILIVMSDQHAGRVSGAAGDKLVRTPTLDALAAAGTVFDAAYTPCPLCAPARMAFLSGRLPMRDGLYFNEQALRSDRATFLHALSARGYETVLCGRMHFNGPDQRHGFQQRIHGDFTGGDFTMIGRYGGSLGYPRAVEDGLFGAGNSPVLEYDRSVNRAAVDYFSRNHRTPQCVVVGTYGPHTPFVAPPERYHYYRDKISLPATHTTTPNHRHPALKFAYRHYDDDTIRRVRAAYYGMVEEQDYLLGQLYQSWQEYLQREGKKGLIIYLSDHGEQIGEHDLYTKCTMLEGSTHIPMVMAGEGIPVNQRVASPVSLLDIAPTLLEMSGADALPEADGQSLLPLLQGNKLSERPVISEMGLLPFDDRHEVSAQVIRQGSWKLLHWDTNSISADRLINEENDLYGTRDRSAEFPEIFRELQDALSNPAAAEKLAEQYPDIVPNAPRKLHGEYLACPEQPFHAHANGYGRMIRRGNWKLISYREYPNEDLLFNIAEDPWELNNLRDKMPELAGELAELLWQGVDVAAINKRMQEDMTHFKLLSAVPASKRPEDIWASPAESINPPISR